MSTNSPLASSLSVETTPSLDFALVSSLEQALFLAQWQLQEFANNSQFFQQLVMAFGAGANMESFQTDWRSGDFSVLSGIEIRSAAELGGAHGAYAAATDRIYLSREFLLANQHNIDRLVSVLLEEAGHKIDARINAVDSAGDEGAIFAQIVQGTLDSSMLANLQAEDDTIFIVIDGQSVLVEQAIPYQGNNLNSIKSGLTNIVGNLNTVLKGTAFANNLPLVGSALKDTTDPATNFLTQLQSALNSQLDTSSVAQAQQTLFNVLGPSGLKWLKDTNGNGIDVNDIKLIETNQEVKFNFSLGRAPTTLSTDIGFDIGLPGLSLAVADGSKVKTDVGFTFNLGFGVNQSGFFVDTNPVNELQVNLDTTIPNFNAQGTLGFLDVGITDISSKPTKFTGVKCQLTCPVATINLAG
jgi:hypothetical protein